MITAQHIYDYLACPHRVYLNAHEDPAKKRPLSQFLDLLFRRGTLYEKRIIEGGKAIQSRKGIAWGM